MDFFFIAFHAMCYAALSEWNLIFALVWMKMQIHSLPLDAVLKL